MRVLTSTTRLYVFLFLSGCHDNQKKATEIVEAAKRGKKPTSDEVHIVHKQMKKEGAALIELEVAELLNLYIALEK